MVRSSSVTINGVNPASRCLANQINRILAQRIITFVGFGIRLNLFFSTATNVAIATVADIETASSRVIFNDFRNQTAWLSRSENIETRTFAPVATSRPTIVDDRTLDHALKTRCWLHVEIITVADN